MSCSRKVLGICAAGLVLALAGPVAGASASKASIRQVLNSYSGKISVVEGHVLSAIGEFKTTHNPASVEEAITKSVSVLSALRTKISHQSAAMPNVRRARTKLVAGLQDVILSYGKLKSAFALMASNPEAAQAEASKALTEVTAGRKKLNEAVRLLR